MKKELTPGAVFRSDRQSDIYGGQYKLIRRIEGTTWEIEWLPADDQVQDEILDYYASQEARYGRFSKTPVWDKKWSECGKNERPQVVGYKTYEDEMAEELAFYAKRAGIRTTMRFISTAAWAEMF